MYSDHCFTQSRVWFGLRFLHYQPNQTATYEKTLIKHMSHRQILIETQSKLL